MKHPFRYIYLSVLPLLSACGGPTQAELNRQKAEQAGAHILQEARAALRASDYNKARSKIEFLRHDIILALDARRRAILLLDSIELSAARDSVRFAEGDNWERLNLKVQFYERKLAEDSKHYGEYKVGE